LQSLFRAQLWSMPAVEELWQLAAPAVDKTRPKVAPSRRRLTI
jgi:hypothetical protein